MLFYTHAPWAENLTAKFRMRSGNIKQFTMLDSALESQTILQSIGKRLEVGENGLQPRPPGHDQLMVYPPVATCNQCFQLNEIISLRCDLIVLGYVAKNTISAITGTFKVTSFQRKSEALRCRIIFMHREVTPPHTAVVPQVMVRVFFIHTES
jgi:hypothetical protein